MNSVAVATTLGEIRILGISVRSELDLVELGERGISKAALLRLARAMGLSLSQVAKLLPVTERTLQRYAPNRKLSQPVTEQAIHLATLYAKGIEVFEDDDRFRAWLRQPCRALGGRIPFDLLRSRFGVEMVHDELIRIEHGVFA